MAEILKESANNIIGEDNIIELQEPSMGVESLLTSPWKDQGLLFLGSGNREKVLPIQPTVASLILMKIVFLLGGNTM